MSKDQQDLFSEKLPLKKAMAQQANENIKNEYENRGAHIPMLSKALEQSTTKNLQYFKMGVDPYDGKDVDASKTDEVGLLPKIPFPHLVDEMLEVAKYYGNNLMKEKQRAYIGIDNGISGSVGIIYEDGTYEFHKTPTSSAQDYTKKAKKVTRVKPLELIALLDRVQSGSMVMIERPMINSTRFHASMSAIRAYEVTLTVLEQLGLPYEVCDSKEWQKPILPIGIKGEDLKKASLDVGHRLFPKTKEVKHADCDGMLIAYFCKTKHK